MTITGGGVRSLADFTTLLPEADLALTKVTPTSSGLAILEVVNSVVPAQAGIQDG
jgi:hypothetical protein